jgi:hypothetical protein
MKLYQDVSAIINMSRLSRGYLRRRQPGFYPQFVFGKRVFIPTRISIGLERG